MQYTIEILWIDDEIEFLKSHILFLENKGYKVLTANNAIDALEILEKKRVDVIFLDENMPGMTGLEMLQQLKLLMNETPVVMITKSEEEQIMETALGSNIRDYLIKPVNPNQILLSLKKIIEQQKLLSQKTLTDYQQTFRELGNDIYEANTFNDWVEVYKRLTFWENALQSSGASAQMHQVLQMQKETANNEFAKYVKKNYLHWFTSGGNDLPILSPQVLKKLFFPLLGTQKMVLLVIDNLRYDQWIALKPYFQKFYKVEQENIYCSILPTATQYARNALFSGLMPEAIRKLKPELWRDENEDGLKNEFEHELFKQYLTRNGINTSILFEKASNLKNVKKIDENPKRFLQHPLSVLVFNFVDILSHARTDVDVVKELASTEPAYRNLTRQWYEHSALNNLVEFLAQNGVHLFLTTDHGSIKVSNPVKIVGDRNTSTNLRYKYGKNLSYESSDVFEITQPEEVGLPRFNVSGSYVFASKNQFFAYPNNYNHYVNYYKDTFQHGGISLEEMLIPAVYLKPIDS